MLSAHTSAKVQKLEQDLKRKQTVTYKQQRRSTRNKNSTATTDHYYGPESQQDDITPSELKVPNDNATILSRIEDTNLKTVFGTSRENWGLRHPILVELQSAIPPHLLATLSSPCCTLKPSPPSHTMGFDARGWGKIVVPGIPEDSGSCQRFCEGSWRSLSLHAVRTAWSTSLAKRAILWRSNALTKLRRKD